MKIYNTLGNNAKELEENLNRLNKLGNKCGLRVDLENTLIQKINRDRN